MTTRPSVTNAFDADHAERYDRQFEAIGAIKDALHLLLRVQLASLPPDARILVAGAGTGAEVRALAPHFSGWQFTLVDPSAAMLGVARRRAEAEGFANRCVFHEGFVGSLPMTPHHAATSVLVSHFLTDATERRAYFADLAARLAPGGLLFEASLCADRADPAFEAVMDLWLGLLALANPATDLRSRYRASFGRDFGAHAPAEVEAMLRQAGFAAPAACYQVGLVRGWVTRRS